jgi:hypothetical protein
LNPLNSLISNFISSRSCAFVGRRYFIKLVDYLGEITLINGCRIADIG